MKLLPKNLLEIKAEVKTLNILIFVAAFILVTGGLIFLNSVYSNIFKFDFSPASARDTLAVADSVSLNNASTELKQQEDKKAKPVEEKDSLKVNYAATSALTEDTVAYNPIKAVPQVIPVQNNPDTMQVNNQTVPAGESSHIVPVAKKWTPCLD